MPVPGSPALILLPVRVFVLTPKPRPPTRTPTLFFPTFMCTPLAIRIRLRKRTVPSFLPPPRCLSVAGVHVQLVPNLLTCALEVVDCVLQAYPLLMGDRFESQRHHFIPLDPHGRIVPVRARFSYANEVVNAIIASPCIGPRVPGRRSGGRSRPVGCRS